MSDSQCPQQISLTLDRNVSQQIVRVFELIRRIMQVDGVQSVSLQSDSSGQQPLLILTSDTQHATLLRRIAAELRKPVDNSRLSSELTLPLDGLASLPAVDANNITAGSATRHQTSDASLSVATLSESADGRPGILGRVRQVFFGTLAVSSVGLAWVGLLVPGVPTVPFVILAAICAAKASPALRERLKRTRVFGPMISDWDKYHAIRREVRVQAIVITLVIVGVTIIVAQPSPALLVVIGAMCVVTLAMIALIPVIESEQPESAKSPESEILPAVA